MDSHVIGADLDVGFAHIPLCGIRRERGVSQQCVTKSLLKEARVLWPMLASFAGNRRLCGQAPNFDTNR